MTDLTIAVLVPAYNEEPVIQGTIAALVAADVRREDIYVVDDRSTDRTAELALAMRVNVLTVEKNGGKAAAQRAALEHFKLLDRYDYVIFMDGDTKVDIYFYNALYAAARNDPDVALFLGQVKSDRGDHLVSAMRAFDYTYGQDVAKVGQDNWGCVFVAPGCASMYRTAVLKTLEIDSTTLAEDMDLTMQVHRAGGKVKYTPEAFVWTQDPLTVRDYTKQMLRWYRGFWQVVRKHRVFSLRTKKQAVDLYMIVMSLDALLFNPLLWALVIGIFFPPFVLGGLALHVAITFLLVMYTARRTRRWDVIIKFPAYFWVAYFINPYTFFRSFLEITIFKKELLVWNKVKRYNFS